MPRGEKRPRSSNACLPCRRNKTRCELPDGKEACHRCSVLCIRCLFDASQRLRPSVRPSLPLDDESIATPTSTASISLPVASSSHVNSTATSERLSALEGAVTSLLSLNHLPSLANFSSISPPNFKQGWSPQTQSMEAHNSSFRPVSPERVLLPRSDDISLDPHWNKPITLVQGLIDRQAEGGNHGIEGDDPVSAGILNAEQMQHLLVIFDERYTPWLNLPPPEQTSPFLRTVCCSLASRHMDPQQRLAVGQQFHALSQQHLLSSMLGHYSQSSSSIRAIQILAMWSSIPSLTHRPARIQTGHMLIAAAQMLATTLHVDEAPLFIAQQGIGKDRPSGDMLENAKLWYSLCATDAISCIGTGRVSVFQCHTNVEEVLNAAPITSLTASRESRLLFLTKLLRIVTRGLRLSLHTPSPSDLNIFEATVNSVLADLDSWKDQFTPFEAVAQCEASHFCALKMQYYGYQSVFLIHVLAHLQLAYHQPIRLKDFKDANDPRVPFIKIWGHKAIISAESAIATINASPEGPSILSSSPDHITTLLCFVSVFIIKANASIFFDIDPDHRFSHRNSELLSKIVDALRSAAVAKDHVTNSCASVVAAFTCWLDDFMKKANHSHSGSTATENHQDLLKRQPDTQNPTAVNSTDSLPMDAGEIHSGSLGSSLMNLDYSQLLASDFFSDPAFFSLFHPSTMSTSDSSYNGEHR